MNDQKYIIINYNDFSNAMIKVKVHDKEISLHDLVTCYNQIQIMKKEGTYPEDFGYTFKAYDWSNKKERLLASEETLTRVVEKYKTERL